MINKTTLSIIILAVFAFSGEVTAQTKKEQIEILKFRVDSLKSVLQLSAKQQDSLIKIIVAERFSNQNKISTLNESMNLLKTQNTKISYDHINVKDSFNGLKSKMNEYLEKTSLFTGKYINYDYDYMDIHNWDSEDIFINVKGILEFKESNRIINSKFAKRDKELHINLLNGGSIKLASEKSENNMLHFYRVYLTENTVKSKLYFIEIRLGLAGSTRDRMHTLKEVNLRDGTISSIVSGIGGEFYFSPNMHYVIVAGEYYEEEMFNNYQFRLINLESGVTEISEPATEAFNIRWTSNEAFDCVLMNFKVDKERWPPAVSYPNVSNLVKHNFKRGNGNWLKTKD
jgi:hypothetical protein